MMGAGGVTGLVHELVRRTLTLACAESLTGGALSSAIVSVPGASETFRGGVVSYATDVKASVLGVPREALAKTGPVDRAVALAMARGVCRLMTSDIGLATTGVAGPGPSDGHPAGTVWIAIAGVCGEETQLLHLPGDRSEVRSGAVRAALALLERHM